MLRREKILGIGFCLIVVLVLLLLSGKKAVGQATASDPIVGTWSVIGTAPGGGILSNFIVTMSFNDGGTTIEYDTTGTNSFMSPGEGMVIGVWRRTGHLTYAFKEQNYIFGDAAGNLSATNITTCHVTVDPHLNSYTGTCDLKFFDCSVALCPGAEIPNTELQATISATRFTL